MRASRGMGDILPSKMPKAKTGKRKDGDKFTVFAKGGGVKSKSRVNEAGNYTKPGVRKDIFNAVKAANIAGTAEGDWSARKAQVVAKRYRDAGGGYKS